MDKFQPGDLVETPNGRGKVIYMTYFEPCGAVNREMDAVMVKHKKSVKVDSVKGAQVWNSGASGTTVIYALDKCQPANGLPGMG